MQTHTLNKALRLSMAFGQDWLKPIQERLKKEDNSLTQEELNECNQICEEMRKEGLNLVSKLLQLSKIKTSDAIQDQWKSDIKKRYPWINKRNLGKFFSQSVYYSYK